MRDPYKFLKGDEEVEKRKTPGIYIIVLVIGIFFISLGIVVLWQSFIMLEGGLLKAPSFLFLTFGGILSIISVRGLIKIKKT